MTYKLFLFILFIISFRFGNGQEKLISFRHITSEDGLSDNRVTCILRDKQGFLWLGTRDGLCRFDGHSFYVFRHLENDSTSLCGNNISCLAYDSDSFLWIGTATSGICSFDFRTQRFKTLDIKKIPQHSNTVNAITYDSSRNALWLGMNSGLHLFSLQTRTIISSNPESLRMVYDVYVRNTTVFVASLLQSLRKTGDPVIQNKLGPALTINTIFEGSDGKLWCGGWDNALHEFSTDARLLQSHIFDGTDKLNFSTNEIISICEDANKILWCGTKNSGLHFFDLRSSSFQSVLHLPQITTKVNSIYRDEFNRMWVGTEKGLYVYDPLLNQFEVTLLPPPDEKINCRVFDRVISGSLEYIVAECGLYYKKKGDKEFHFRYFNYRNERLQLTSMFKSADGNIYIGTNKTTFILDTTHVELKQIDANEKLKNILFFTLYSSRITGLADVPFGNRNLIAALAYGHTVLMADVKRKNVFWHGISAGDTTTHLESFQRKIMMDRKKKLWVCGSTYGITQILFPRDFHPDSFPVLHNQYQKIDVETRRWENTSGNRVVRVNDVYDIVENDDGSYWLSSEVSGLIRFYPDKKDFPFSFVEGQQQSLQGLAKQDENTLWMITSKGFLNYQVNSGIYKLFDSKQGVPQGIAGHFFSDCDSILSAGFEGGFVSFNPKKILKDKEQPQVHVTRLWVMDQPSDSLLLSNLKFSYKRNFLKFYLSSNCFSDNEQVTYLFQLVGIDQDWRTNGHDPYITYTNLPPGKFEFRFKAVNSDGVESEIGSKTVIITPPFYNTISFYFLVGITIFFSALSFYRYRISQLMKIQEVRNKIARDLHDDIGSTIGSINLYSQVANLKLGEIKNEEVKSILEKIETSSREVIDKTGDAVWAANPSNDSLKNLLLRMEGYAASVLGTAEISFKIVCDEKLSELPLKMDDRKNLFLIFKEAIHNIIKYAEATEVEIRINKQDNSLQMTITDNGKGFSMNGTVYNGNGIKNMKARVKSMNGTLSITSEEKKGTVVKISI